MGRRLPPPETSAFVHPPALSPPLVAICVAATAAVIISLCASLHHRRPSSARKTLPPPPSPNSSEKTETAVPMTPTSTSQLEQPRSSPAAAAAATPDHVIPSGPKHKPKLSKSLSMKLPDKVLSKIRTATGRPKSAEDSVWMKTILLGEKCKAPSLHDHEEEEEEEEEEAEQAKAIRARSTATRSTRGRKLLTSFSMRLSDRFTKIRSASKERREKSTDVVDSLWREERLKVVGDDDDADDVEHAATRGPISSRSLTSALRRKLSLSNLRIGKKEREEDKGERDSIWRKAIILGDKCHVPSDDEEPAVFDDKGNRKRSYRPRSQPVSRSNSFLNRGMAPH